MNYTDRLIAFKQKRSEFEQLLSTTKSKLNKEVVFFPYSIMSNLHYIDELLKPLDLCAEDILLQNSINDIGGADGDIAFYCEFLGAKTVNMIDYSPTNFNKLKGAMKLKEAFKSSVNIIDTNLDTMEGWDAVDQTEYSIFLNTLYHIQNPVFTVSKLTSISNYLLMSSKVFDLLGGKNVSAKSIAYFYYPGECNNDSSNWWCYTDTCLKTIVNRGGWEIISYYRNSTAEAEPVDMKKDGRAYLYLKNRPR